MGLGGKEKQIFFRELRKTTKKIERVGDCLRGARTLTTASELLLLSGHLEQPVQLQQYGWRIRVYFQDRGHPRTLGRIWSNRNEGRALSRTLCAILRTVQDQAWRYVYQARVNIRQSDDLCGYLTNVALSLHTSAALRDTSSYFAVSTPTIHMVSGVAAGFLSTTLTHPFDMLKTRMQLKPAEYKNVLQGARKVLLVRIPYEVLFMQK